jgi:hypothetical protein
VPYVVGGTIFGLAFNSDGSTLAAVNDSSTTTLIPSIVVDEPTSALAQHLCAEIRGNLTALQWSADIGDAVPYRQVCPGY